MVPSLYIVMNAATPINSQNVRRYAYKRSIQVEMSKFENCVIEDHL